MSTGTKELVKSQDVAYDAADPALAALGFEYSSLMTWAVAPQSTATPAPDSSAIDAAGQAANSAAQGGTPLLGFEETAKNQEALQDLVTSADVDELVKALQSEFASHGIAGAAIENIAADLRACVGKPRSVLTSQTEQARSQFREAVREADENFLDKQDMIQAYLNKMYELNAEVAKKFDNIGDLLSDETKAKQAALEKRDRELKEQEEKNAEELAKAKQELEDAIARGDDAAIAAAKARISQLNVNMISLLTDRQKLESERDKFLEQAKKEAAGNVRTQDQKERYEEFEEAVDNRKYNTTNNYAGINQLISETKAELSSSVSAEIMLSVASKDADVSISTFKENSAKLALVSASDTSLKAKSSVVVTAVLLPEISEEPALVVDKTKGKAKPVLTTVLPEVETAEEPEKTTSAKKDKSKSTEKAKDTKADAKTSEVPLAIQYDASAAVDHNNIEVPSALPKLAASKFTAIG